MSLKEKNVLDTMHIRRIAVFRALFLGDMLLCVPALRALRQHFPVAEITLIGLPWAAAFVQRYSRYIDRYVEFAGYPGLKEVPIEPARVKNFLAEQAGYGYDLVIQMHGSGLNSNPFALTLHGTFAAGFYIDTPPAGLTFAAPYPHLRHEILRNLDLAQLVGCSRLDQHLEFPLHTQDEAEATILLGDLDKTERPLIGLHPGASAPSRRWPAAYFAHAADALAQRYNAQILLTGSIHEEELAWEVMQHMKTRALNVAGQTSLGGLAAIMKRLSLFISNDTGTAHLACATDCPSLMLFGPGNYRCWAPLDSQLHKMVRRPVACSPCGYTECPIDHRCLRWLTPPMVLKAAQQILAQHGSNNVERGRRWQ